MLTRYQTNKIENNLHSILNDANKETYINGLNWYKNENSWCKNVAKKYNLDPYIVAAVFSALSPRNKLDKNKLDTITVIEAYQNNLQPTDIKVSTFHNNKHKAFDILACRQEISINSLKTYSFVKNLALLDEKFVTVDVWHLRASFLNMRYKKAVPSALDYKQITKCTLKVAKDNNIKGFELQAIVWEQIRNNYLTTYKK